LNPYDEFWDRRLGIRTFGFHPGFAGSNDDERRIAYIPTPYFDIFRVLKAAGLTNKDVFVDLGSGLGRAVFAASWIGAHQAIGVEIETTLIRKAIGNVRRSRVRPGSVEFCCTPAENYRNRNATCVFMFHPFGEKTLRLVLKNLELDWSMQKEKDLRIIYLNPVYENLLDEFHWLKCIERIPASKFWPPSSMRHYEAMIWRARS
jgi:hypothetical protein